MTRRKLLSILGLCGLTSACTRHIQTTDGDGSEKHPYEDRLAHGPLDEINSRQLYARQQVAGYLMDCFGGLGCFRCNWPFQIVHGYMVWYSKGNGCFALCQDCWDELITAENRIPYYRKLNDEQYAQYLGYRDKWPSSTNPRDEWPAVEAAIKKQSELFQSVWYRQ